MDKQHSDLVQEHFDLKYQDYDVLIRKLIPRYEEMHRFVVQAVGLGGYSRRILDLGIGTGQTAEVLFEKFPEASIAGVDISGNMLNQAKERLAAYESRVQLFQEDMETFVPLETYGACVAVLSIHHLEGLKKRILFKKIHGALAKGGTFVIGDIVIFDSKEEAEQKEAEWMGFLRQGLGEQGAQYWFDNYVEEDRPSSVSDQVTWLKEVGFDQVEVLWEHINYAVIRATK